MKLRTVVRDCLFLNWALPAAALPKPPAPLRYQRHEWQGAEYVFASALLFHHDAVRWAALPLLRVGYPQLNVRLYALDEDGVPSVLFLRELMPAWVAPGVRLLSHHPVASARLDFPRPSREAGAASWRWRARHGATLTVKAWIHAPSIGEGPRIGSWEETVRYFQDRPRGYARQHGVLYRVQASHPPADAVWPLAAEVEGGDTLLSGLEGSRNGRGAGLAGGSRLAMAGTAAAAPGGFDWPALHSCWLCPEMPFSIAFDLVPKVHPVVNGLPHPAAGRVSSAALFSGITRVSGAAVAGVAGATAPAVPALAGEMGGAAGVLASAA
jgi:uncharacterized protein YqjF (DUF2071 family)